MDGSGVDVTAVDLDAYSGFDPQSIVGQAVVPPDHGPLDDAVGQHRSLALRVDGDDGGASVGLGAALGVDGDGCPFAEVVPS